MMRGGFIACIFCLICLTLYAQKNTCYTTEIATVNATGKVYNLVSIEYDKNRNVVHKKTVMDFGGIPTVTSVFNTYNEKNQLIKTQNTYNKRITNASEYTYDILGNKLTERQLIDGVLSSTSSFSGNSEELNNYEDDGSVSTKVKTVKSKNEEIKTILNSNDEMISQEITTYSDNGLKIKYEEIEPQSFFSKSTQFIYNVSGKLIEENHMYNDKISLQLIYQYDGEYLKEHKGLLPNGKEQFRIEYYYTDGLLTEIKNFTDDVFITVVEKKYDTHRNLSEEITSNNKGQILTSTKYTYECDESSRHTRGD